MQLFCRRNMLILCAKTSRDNLLHFLSYLLMNTATFSDISKFHITQKEGIDDCSIRFQKGRYDHLH